MIGSVQTNTMNTTTEQLIHNLTDDNGNISWSDARCIARGHGLLDEFITDQVTNLDAYFEVSGIRAAQFANWLGY